MKIEKKVYSYIKENSLIEEGDSLLLTISGGKDSVFMLEVLKSLKSSLEISKFGIIHINHNIRGDESDADEEFVKKLGKKNKIETYIESIDIKKIALEESKSLEEAGREQRYRIFDKYAETKKFDKIATAHTKNDQVETLLMRLFKGTGLKGFKGIPKKRENIIRPILNVKTEDVYKYLEKKEISFRKDETNEINTYDRNKIRNEIIPVIEDINPKFVDSIIRFKKILGDAKKFIDKSVEENIDKYFYIFKDVYVLELDKIDKSLHKEVLHKIFIKHYEKTISFGKVKDILELYNKDKSGKYLNISKNIEIHYNYGRLFFSHPTDFFVEDEYQLTEGENYIKKYRVKILCEKVEKMPFKIKKNEFFIPQKYISNQFLKVRTRQHGDRFVSERTGKHRKLKKYFNDIKLPRVYRDKVLMVADDERIYAILDIEKSIYVDIRDEGPFIRISYTFEEEGGNYDYYGAIIKR